jgi:hypothetical protein
MTTEMPCDEGLNLKTYRASSSVWDRQHGRVTAEQLAAARWLVGIGGAALAIQGIRFRTRTGGMLAGLGAGLTWWAVTGEGDLSEARRWFLHVLEPWLGREDLVNQASTESFPASDPPSWTATVGTGVRRETSG